MGNERDELDEVLSFSDGLQIHSNDTNRQPLADALTLATVSIYARARTIRSRERKLAELAREAFKILARAKVLGMEDEREAAWLRRYEEALK